MADKSKIQWTDATWPVTKGCSKESDGCKNCYAMRTIWRLSHNPRLIDEFAGLVKMTSHGPEWTGVVKPHPKRLDQPLRWRKPRRVFVNSQSDLFHPYIPFRYQCAVFGVMAAAGRHTFQVLTKRGAGMRWFFERLDEMAQRLESPFPHDPIEWRRGHLLRAAALDYVSPKLLGDVVQAWPLPNVWLGVSTEDQQMAARRVPHLLACPAAIRFVSAEPLLDMINLKALDARMAGHTDMFVVNALNGRHYDLGQPCRQLNSLDWVIIGGESGPRARLMDLARAQSLVRQCRLHGVAAFVKQLGSAPGSLDYDICKTLVQIKHPKGGNIDEWTGKLASLAVRQWPKAKSAT